MIIQIDPETRIQGTRRCWELQRLRRFKKTHRWEAYKWFSTFRQALEEAVHREIRLHPATTLSDAIVAVSDVTQRFERLTPKEYRQRR